MEEEKETLTSQIREMDLSIKEKLEENQELQEQNKSLTDEL